MPSHNRNRRKIIKSAVAATSGIALGHLFSSLAINNAHASAAQQVNESLPLSPVTDDATGLNLLKLPEGFSYTTFGWTGDQMNDGTYTPDRHDGMAVVDYDDTSGVITLMRNHERGEVNDLVIGNGIAPIYDHNDESSDSANNVGGGVTALRYRDGKLLDSQAALGGTLFNCAGGATPWGSWLTCEEYVVSQALNEDSDETQHATRDHGYVFEVPAPHLGQASAQPIVSMGKMKHEAVAVDPVNGIVYLTEDNGPNSGFYRFIPKNRAQQFGALEEGGLLQMLKVTSRDNVDLTSPMRGDTHPVEWVTIENPNMDGIEGESGPYRQGKLKGGAKFLRGEGCWYHKDVIYFVDTSGGTAGKGVVWVYKPSRTNNFQGELIALFVSPGQETANNPDNITISPRDGILVCEDGGSFTSQYGSTVGSRLVAINQRGVANIFAENIAIISSPLKSKPRIALGDYRGQEFCGACFDPIGKTLFVNIQTPGITFAIKGPWHQVGL